MSDTEDPLNIGRCVTTETKTIPVQDPVVLLKKSESGPVHLLDDSDRRVRRPSILKMSKQVHEEFNSEMPNLQSRIPNSTSFTLMPDLAQAQRPITQEECSEFEKFLRLDTIYNTGITSAPFRQQRRTQFQRSIDDVRALLRKLKVSLDCCLDRRSELMKLSVAVLAQLQGLRRMGAEVQRKNAALITIYYRKQMKIEKWRSEAVKRNIERTVNFIEFLKGMDKDGDLLPVVDVRRFELSFEDICEKANKLSRQVAILATKRRELVEQKPGTGDWYFNILHPKSKTGKIIKRFEERIELLTYEDVCTIIQHLSSANSDFARLEQLLFDLAWQKRPYPFGLVRETPLPTKGDFFPAVVGKTVVNQEYAFTPFSVLNGMDWPFKTAVDKIFEMMILTNPFSIARVFWDVIQEAAQCMQKVLVDGGMNPDDVEIDFDSLFPILMICVFAFGIDEWMTVALYTISFNEQVNDDPQLQFAMTYLEGLITHIMALDKKKLKEKSIQMRSKWADEQQDPLGVH